jgi:hypothetical protein
MRKLRGSLLATLLIALAPGASTAAAGSGGGTAKAGVQDFYSPPGPQWRLRPGAFVPALSVTFRHPLPRGGRNDSEPTRAALQARRGPIRPARRATVGRVEHVRLPDPRLSVHGRRVACTTRIAYAGAYQLTVWTIVPELAAELHSSYLGHPDGDTAVTHLQLRPEEPPLTLISERPGAELPVREARRLCLYDHLAELRRLVSEATGLPAGVEVPEHALELVDVA